MSSGDQNPASSAARWQPLPLTVRLTAWYSVSSFVLVLAATVVLYWSHSASMHFQDEEFLLNKIHVMAALLKGDTRNQVSIREEIGEDVDGPRQLYVRVVETDLRTIYESPGMSGGLPPELFPAPISGVEHGRSIDVLSLSGNPFRLLASYAIRNGIDGAQQVVIQAAIERSTEEQLLGRYRERLALVLLVALISCAAIGHQIARVGLAPLRRIVTATGRIQTSTLHERIDAQRLPAELMELTRTFNDMLDRLQASFEQVLQFSDDLAHELRTPINNMMGGIEVALSKDRTSEEYRETLESAVEECGRLSRTIGSLLFLARSENGSPLLERERLDLRSETAVIVAFFEAPAHEACVTLKNEIEPSVVALADRVLLQRALSNLVTNALAHSQPGGAVSIAARRRGDLLGIEIADTGCGIAPEHLPHVFERFYRVDRARSATNVGLGLAIVKRIALLHGGHTEIVSQPGHGSRVTIFIPAASSAPSLSADYETVISA